MGQEVRILIFDAFTPIVSENSISCFEPGATPGKRNTHAVLNDSNLDLPSEIVHVFVWEI